MFAQNPFAWDTVQDKLYSFCSNASGALAPDALAALGKSKMMIHGMEEGATLPPVWQNSEAKIGLAAAQLRAVNPSQLQLYTVQIVRADPRTPRQQPSRFRSRSVHLPLSWQNCGRTTLVQFTPAASGSTNTLSASTATRTAC